MDINIKPTIFINGIVICCLAIVMTIPLVLDLILWSGSSFNIFLSAIIACVFLGGLMIFSCYSKEEISFSKIEIFFLVVSIWCITSIVGAFPFYAYSKIKLSFVSALFESVSGITTTGCSVYPNVEILPRAINLWRFILHFIGGVGIVAIGIFILPIMRIGGMQLFLTENSDKTQKILPRASQIVGFFIGVYTIFIVIFAILLKLSGLTLFDSVCHAISAISTGGFSTKNSGIIGFQNFQTEIIMSLAMFIGGITFLEIVRSFKYGIKTFWNNIQIKTYIKLTIVMTITPILIALLNNKIDSIMDISSYILQTISAITTTGLDYPSKYLHPQLLLILLALIGGCSGSTTSGIKIFRIQILWAVLKNQINKLLKPFDVSVPKYQNKKIDESLLISIASFFFALTIVFVCSVGIIELVTGKNISECVFSVSSCLFNLGYDFNISEFGKVSQIVFLCDMLIGRLEFIPFIVVLSQIKNFFK